MLTSCDDLKMLTR